jgi:hypothetical protein
MSLEIDGKVLCHIINFFRIYTCPAPNTLSRVELQNKTIDIRMPFGVLSVRREDSAYNVTFQSGTPEELATPRMPFTYLDEGSVRWRQGFLQFEKEVVVAMYFNAIHHGISDTKALIPEPTASLKNRAEALLHSMSLIENTDDPVFSTEKWLNDASRIKRRITTNSDDDESLVDAFINGVSKKPDVAERLERLFLFTSPRRRSASQWKDHVRSFLNTKCLFNGERLEFIWHSQPNTPNRTFETLKDILVPHLRTALEKFKALPTGNWLYGLSDMTEEVLELMDIGHEWLVPDGIVLELTRDSSLWKADCKICG